MQNAADVASREALWRQSSSRLEETKENLELVDGWADRKRAKIEHYDKTWSG